MALRPETTSRFAFYGRVSSQSRSPRDASRSSARRTSIEEAIRKLEGRRPDGARPDEIDAMLAAVPDFRPTLETASFEELADLLEAFDVTAVYDKAERTLVLGATVTPELVPDNEQPRRSGVPSGISSIAGERSAPVSDPVVRVEMVAANRV
jgi:hypothetical protein